MVVSPISRPSSKGRCGMAGPVPVPPARRRPRKESGCSSLAARSRVLGRCVEGADVVGTCAGDPQDAHAAPGHGRAGTRSRGLGAPHQLRPGHPVREAEVGGTDAAVGIRHASSRQTMRAHPGCSRRRATPGSTTAGAVNDLGRPAPSGSRGFLSPTHIGGPRKPRVL